MQAKKEGTQTKYSHLASFRGSNDLISNLPNKEDDYNKFSKNIYSALANQDSVYFLDKTPNLELKSLFELEKI